MNFLGRASPSSGRRSLLKSGLIFAAAGVLVAPSLAFAGAATIDVTAAPYSAAPSLADNSPAFQAALTALAGQGGGRLYVPTGQYVLGSPLTYSGGALTVFGDGQDSTVLANSHGGTVLAINFNDTSKCLTVRDLGFAPCSGGQSQCAIAVTVVAQPSGWQNVVIEDVSIGIPDFTTQGIYTSYNNAILLTNTTRARISNVNVHANSITGNIAIALAGECFDTRILGCTLEGYNYGVEVMSYCEGLHLANNVIICGTAVSTGWTNYNTGAFSINLLELLMSDCEINTMSECLYLYQVKNAQITNCHFSGPKNGNGGSAIDLRGCTNSLVNHCTFDGFWSPGLTPMFGIAFNASSRIPTTSCHVSDVQFENTAVAIYLGAGAQSNTASYVQLLAPGGGALVDGSVVAGGQLQQEVFIDVSGNGSNNVSWQTSASTISSVASRRVTSEH